MSSNNCNKPAFVGDVDVNVQAAGNLGIDIPSEAVAGTTAVLDPTAGSYEALVAGNAAAVGFWRFLEVDTGLEVLVITARRA